MKIMSNSNLYFSFKLMYASFQLFWVFHKNKSVSPQWLFRVQALGTKIIIVFTEDVSSSTATSLALAVASSTAAAMMTNTQFNMANSGMEMGDGENMGGGMMGHMTHMGPMAHMGPNPMMMGPMNMGQVIVIITCCVLLICHILCSFVLFSSRNIYINATKGLPI